MARTLPKKVDQAIKTLCAEADTLLEEGEESGREAAWRKYWEAFDLVPEPKTDWEATTWVLAAIGDMMFTKAKPDYQGAAKAFEDAVRCPGGLGNPFIHLRIGQCYFELGDKKRAADELSRAYMGAGREIFAEQDPKYMKLVEKVLRPPEGHDRLP